MRRPEKKKGLKKNKKYAQCPWAWKWSITEKILVKRMVEAVGVTITPRRGKGEEGRKEANNTQEKRTIRLRLKQGLRSFYNFALYPVKKEG